MNQQRPPLADLLVAAVAIALSPPVVALMNFLRVACVLGAIATFAITSLGFVAALKISHGHLGSDTFVHFLGGIVLAIVLFFAVGVLGIIPRLAQRFRMRL